MGAEQSAPPKVNGNAAQKTRIQSKDAEGSVLRAATVCVDPCYSAPEPSKTQNRTIQRPSTKLHQAALQGDLGKVYSLLGESVSQGLDDDVNKADELGRTALHFAALGNHVTIVKALVGAKADVTLRAKDGKTALNYAADHQNPEVLRYFVDLRAQQKGHDAASITSSGVLSSMPSPSPTLYSSLASSHFGSSTTRLRNRNLAFSPTLEQTRFRPTLVGSVEPEGGSGGAVQGHGDRAFSVPVSSPNHYAAPSFLQSTQLVSRSAGEVLASQARSPSATLFSHALSTPVQVSGPLVNTFAGTYTQSQAISNNNPLPLGSATIALQQYGSDRAPLPPPRSGEAQRMQPSEAEANRNSERQDLFMAKYDTIANANGGVAESNVGAGIGGYNGGAGHNGAERYGGASSLNRGGMSMQEAAVQNHLEAGQVQYDNQLRELQARLASLEHNVADRTSARPAVTDQHVIDGLHADRRAWGGGERMGSLQPESLPGHSSLPAHYNHPRGSTPAAGHGSHVIPQRLMEPAGIDPNSMWTQQGATPPRREFLSPASTAYMQTPSPFASGLARWEVDTRRVDLNGTYRDQNGGAMNGMGGQQANQAPTPDGHSQARGTAAVQVQASVPQYGFEGRGGHYGLAPSVDSLRKMSVEPESTTKAPDMRMILENAGRRQTHLYG